MLLDDIIQLATDDQKSIVVLLRHCLVLAHRINNEPLRTWADKELNGYRDDDELPDYRVIPARAKGQFSGGESAVSTHLIPPALLEEQHRHIATVLRLTEGIVAYEDLIKGAEPGGTISMPWPPNLILYYRERIYDAIPLTDAYHEIPKSGLVELLDTVRTRVLNMALEIHSEVGENDRDLKQVAPNTENRINQTVIQRIYGGDAFVSTGHSSMTVEQQSITNNWERLAGVLEASGLSKPELEELSSAINRDGKQMGPWVTGWIKKTAPNVLTNGEKVGATVGQILLTESLKQYFGLPA